MIGNKIKELRISRGWSQQKLADAAGVSQLMISRCERGVVFPSIGTCLLICKALGKYLDEVFYVEKGGET